MLCTEGKGVREIAREIGRSPSTILRELRRNAATRGGKLEYRASVAQWRAEQRAKRPKAAKLRIWHEAIYQSLFVQGRGALACELTACLRTGRALRVSHARVGKRGKASSPTR